MARLRTIKPGFFLDEYLAECQPLARILFAGLWCIADREGRLEDRPRRIKAECLPYDDCDVEQLLDELLAHGFIMRYSVNGGSYITIPKWAKHQSPHQKEAASTIPAPDLTDASTIPALEFPPSSCLGSCLTNSSGSCLDGEPPVDSVDKSRPRKSSEELPEFTVTLTAPVAKIVGHDAIPDLLTDGTDLNTSCRQYIAVVDELVDDYLGDLTEAKRATARETCRKAAFARLSRDIKNLPAYLTAAAGNATCLGDLVGDDTVAELRKPKRGKA